ncbi:MAG TPA: c-type cytochrome [Thermoanaerobaculia bacterium]
MTTRFTVLFGLTLLLVSAAAIAAAGRQPEPAKTEIARLDAAPPAAAPAAAPAATPAKPKFDEAKALADLRKEIAGKEDEPAGKVFMDIDVMQNVTAGQLLRIMEKGYARSLGVTCTHCHVPGQWESNEKKEKEAARGMIRMNATINNELLPKVRGLDTDHKPLVNCTTCHRGQVRPALQLP